MGFNFIYWMDIYAVNINRKSSFLKIIEIYRVFQADMIRWGKYYNKEYREGFPRKCLLTAAVSESPNPKGLVIHSLPR